MCLEAWKTKWPMTMSATSSSRLSKSIHNKFVRRSHPTRNWKKVWNLRNNLLKELEMFQLWVHHYWRTILQWNHRMSYQRSRKIARAPLEKIIKLKKLKIRESVTTNLSKFHKFCRKISKKKITSISSRREDRPIALFRQEAR